MSGSDEQRRTACKVLVACLGNPDRGDDGVGAAVARALAGRLRDGAALVVRSGDMLALIDEWTGFDAVVCVDAAAPMDAPLGAPGHIRRVDLARDELPVAAPRLVEPRFWSRGRGASRGALGNGTGQRSLSMRSRGRVSTAAHQ